MEAIIHNGFKWSIGSGTNISIWEDNHWIPSGHTIPPLMGYDSSHGKLITFMFTTSAEHLY